MPDTTPVISAKNLNLWYGDFKALKNISLDVGEREITALIGPSGCGKSTFLKTLNRMNDLVPGVRIEGDVRLKGQDIFAREMELTTLRRRVGMVFQKANPFPMSIYDNITYGPKLHGVHNKAELDELVESSLKGAALCIDATHPYAVEATKNIKAAAEKAGVGYLRLLRPASPLPENCLVFESAKQAAEALAAEEGNLLLATGAKELTQFAAIPPQRLYPRVLPTLESIAACEAAGIPHRNIIAMQGPFSYALNRALMEQFAIRFLVTKDGGAAGGFAEKAQAAAQCGVQLIVLRRPEEQGETAETILQRCRELL